MVKPMPIDVRTMIGDVTFGSTCSRIIRRHAERDRGLDEGLVPERVYLGVDEAAEPRPIGDGQREDDVLNGRAERLRYGDGEDDLEHAAIAGLWRRFRFGFSFALGLGRLFRRRGFHF